MSIVEESDDGKKLVEEKRVVLCPKERYVKIQFFENDGKPLAIPKVCCKELPR